MERDLVMLTYSEQQEEKYIIYQTPESNRFLSPLTNAMAAAYVGVPNWAIPVGWSGNLATLQELDRVSKQDYLQWMGMDGGFSAILYAAALAYHVEHKLDIGSLADGQQDIETRVQSQQPRRLVSTPGPKVVDLVALAKA